MKYFNCPMPSSLFSSFQENTKYESSFFADTCTRRVPIFNMATARNAKYIDRAECVKRSI